MRLLRTKLSRWKVGELFFLLYCLFFTTNIVLSTTSHNDNECPSICTCDETIGIVNCNDKGLKEIPQRIPVWVKQVLLRNNRISANGILLNDFSRFHVLEELDLSGNKLLNFSADFTGLESLRKITLEHCSLSTLPQIKTSSNLTHLLLSHNSISDASNNLGSYSTLQHLDLSFNKFRQIKPDTFLSQRLLKYLNLQKNRISSLTWSSFSGLLSIDTLDLSRNKIRSIVSIESSKPSSNKDSCKENNEDATIDEDRERTNLQSLRTLNLSQNLLTHIDGLTFSGMCSLETLLVDRNRISQLGDGSFYGPTALKTLILDHNHIGSIKKGWLFRLEALETLSVAHNNLTAIEPDGWKFCTKLTHLDLSHNRLTSLPSHGFSKLGNLQSFLITNNQIAFLEDFAFDGLGQLVSLDLSNNIISSSIEDIDGAFLGLESIQTLSLRENRIRSLSASALEGIESVVSLDLRHNDVTSIQNHTFDEMTNLQSLLMNSSSFLCDCQLAWFPSWLKSMKQANDEFQYSVEGTCFHPPALKGRDIMNISTEEFICVAHPIPILLLEPMSRTALIGDNITLQCSASATYTELRNETLPSTLSPTPPATDKSLGNSENPLRMGQSDDPRNPLKDSTLVAPPLQTPGDLHKSGESRSRSGGFPLKADEPQKEPEKKRAPPQRRNAERIDLDKNGMTVTWKRGQEILHQGPGIEIRNVTRQKGGYVYVTSLLVMKGVTTDETGKYNCIISNNYGYARSKPVEVVVNEYPRFTKTPANVTIVRNGSSAVLNCAATGQPPPQIQWQKDGGEDFPAATERRLRREQTNILKPFVSDDHDTSNAKGERGGMFLKPGNGDRSDSGTRNRNSKFAVDSDAPLDFAVVLPVDAGEYECVAESSVGRIVTKAMLIVEMPPSFKKSLPEESESSVGTNTAIQCIVDAQPDPNIRWSFNRAPLNLTGRHYLVKNQQMLVITNVEKSDAGIYTCDISNKYGAVSHTMKLRVTGGDSGFLPSLLNAEFPLWLSAVIVVAVIIVTVLITGVCCYFRYKRKQDKASSLTTGTTDLERAPLDENSLVSTDESVRKGQSSQSIHLPEYESNISRVPDEQNSRLTYGGSASTSDISRLQILQSPSTASTAPLFPNGIGCKPLAKRSNSSTAIQKNQITISRFRSAENFGIDECHQMHQLSAKRNGQSRGMSCGQPITSPSAAFAKKAAGDENYVPVTLKTQQSRTGGSSKRAPSSGKTSKTKPSGSQTSTTTQHGEDSLKTGTSSGRSSTTTPPGDQSSKPAPLGSRTFAPRTSSDRSKERKSAKKTKRSKKSKAQPHITEQTNPKGKLPTSNGKLPNSFKVGVAGTHPLHEQTNNHFGQYNEKDSFVRAQVHEPLDRRKNIRHPDDNQPLGGARAPDRPIHKTSSSSSGPVDFSSNTTLSSESSTLLHHNNAGHDNCPPLHSEYEREKLLSR